VEEAGLALGQHSSGRLILYTLDGALNDCSNLFEAIGSFDALAYDPQIVCGCFRMDGKAYEDRGAGECVDQAPADFVEKPLPLVVDAAASQVDPRTLKGGACVPVDLYDVGIHGHPLLTV
jgi:hypothetical protein